MKTCKILPADFTSARQKMNWIGAQGGKKLDLRQRGVREVDSSRKGVREVDSSKKSVREVDSSRKGGGAEGSTGVVRNSGSSVNKFWICRLLTICRVLTSLDY